MCGRYGLFHDGGELAAAFGADIAELAPAYVPRYNVAPTQGAPIVVPRDGGGRVFLTARWGLIPHWVREPGAFKATLVNARAETAHQKPAFRDALRDRRCVVPISAFYEWKKPEVGGAKQPYMVRRRDGAPMALAGLWAAREGREPPASYTILTTRPNALTALLHDRQPVILPPEALPAWFDPERRDPEELEAMLGPGDPSELEAIPISTAVNAPSETGPEVIRPSGDPLRLHA